MIGKILGFNRVVLTMVVVDFFVNGALGVIGPFFAIFITEQVRGGDIAAVGFATAAYWVTKSIFQLPIAKFLDKTDGEKDEFWAFFLGYLASSFVPLFYYFASEAWHIYLVQAFFGFAMAWAIPAWYAIFTRHLDRYAIGFEWSLVSVFSLGVAATLSAALGGMLIRGLGFRVVFLLASAVMFLSALAVLSIRKSISLKRGSVEKVIPEFKHKRN